MEACGAVDELNAALGMARALNARATTVGDALLPVQKELVCLMGELATLPADWPRYQADGFGALRPEMTARLDGLIRAIEARVPSARDWVMPGGNAGAAALDVARTVCRRAERHICGLQEQGELRNPEIVVYLNRLSDLLWLLAREAESAAKADLTNGPIDGSS